MYWCYVIYSTTRYQYYIGVTDDVVRRVQDHNCGVSKWTKGKSSWQLEWSKEFMSPVNADEDTLQAVEDWHCWCARGYQF